MDALFKCGGIDKPWTAGDNVNLAVGQGDLQATPIQLAVAYAALANDGTIVRPHLGKAVEDANGFAMHEHPPDAAAPDRVRRARPRRDPRRPAARRRRGGRHVRRRLEGLADALPRLRQDRHGGARDEPDQAWYVCFVNDPERPIVVVVTVEKGGFGAETAAPAARLILSKWFDVKDRQFHTGSSATR